MKKLQINLLMVLAIIFLSGVCATAAKAQCRDPWVGQVINELIGRRAQGSGDTGECNFKLYGGGSWSNYGDLQGKVRASLFNSNPEKTKERCFGAQGSGCDALQFGVFDFKAGRTNLGGGRYNMWMSVGSIVHDNCCIANPYGKMCGGNDAAKSLTGNGDGNCVQEWDKAFWNAADGRAWSIETNDYSVPDLTIVTNPRSTKSRNGQVLNRFETAETRKRSAPAGQALDVGDEQYCQSGRARTYNVPFTSKTWIICQ